MIIHPVGFLSDHMEVLYDLDEEAMRLCKELGLPMVCSRTVGTHRGFVRMLRELICEARLEHPAGRAPVSGTVRAGSRHLPHRLLPASLAVRLSRTHAIIRVARLGVHPWLGALFLCCSFAGRSWASVARLAWRRLDFMPGSIQKFKK